MSLVNYRLPRTILPKHYELHMNPDLKNFTFSGYVRINIDITQPTDTIILNSKNLSIRDSIYLSGNKCNFTENKDDEIIIIKKEDLAKINDVGSYLLSISFDGILNDQMAGFYRSTYKLPNGETSYMATTQFESTDARQAFPCFDEPSFKATFDINIVAPRNKTVLSNTDIKSVALYGINYDTQRVTFDTTPVMSTYLVAFIVGDLEYSEKKTSNNITVRAYATPGNKDKLSFALDIAVKALDWYIKWFNIDYPLTKLDLVAIPDFSAGAMENWGLITFRESDMLCDENTGLNEKQRIAYVVCHEIAHQWFGNLVTMEWWTYLWLNESMATYFGWLVVDALFPEWHVWNKFIDQEYIHALELDSLESSHPIEVPVQKASDVQQIFDAISYSKGSCLIRFLVNYLGQDDFRKGMQKYLLKNQYANTTSDDLWQAFSDVKDIKSLMQNWTKQTGYPVVCCDCNANKKLVLSQTRFYKYGPKKLVGKQDSNNDTDSFWIIPLEVQLQNSNISLVLDKPLDTYTLETLDSAENMMLNPKRMVLLRVMYAYNIPNITNLSLEDKNALLNDSFCLALSGYQDFSKIFQIIDKLNLPLERNYNIWSSVTEYLDLIHSYLENHKDMQEKFMNTIVTICKPLESLHQQLGWDDIDNESINDKELRDLILMQLSFQKNESVIKEAFRRFYTDKWLSKKLIILVLVGKYGSLDDYKKLIAIYETTTSSQVKETLLTAFSSVRRPESVKLNLELVMSNKIRDQDLLSYISCLSNNKYTRDSVWNLITTNWSKFIEKYPKGSSGLGYLVKVMANGFKTEEDLAKYKEFFKIRPEGTDMSISQTIERISNKMLIIKRVSMTFGHARFACALE